MDTMRRCFGYDRDGKKSTVESLMCLSASGKEGKEEDTDGDGKQRGWV